jgi:hypothetical protein
MPGGARPPLDRAASDTSGDLAPMQAWKLSYSNALFMGWGQDRRQQGLLSFWPAKCLGDTFRCPVPGHSHMLGLPFPDRS